MNIGGLLSGVVLHIEGKIDKISWTSPADSSYSTHSTICNICTKLCLGCNLLYFAVVQKWAKFGVQTAHNFFMLSMSIFLKWDIGMLNMS